MPVSGDRHDERRGFFGRRKGKKLRPGQAGLFDTLLPRLAIDPATPSPADVRSLFARGISDYSRSIGDVRLEIGFGGAEHLVAQARNNPGAGFIGSEAFVNAMAKLLAAIETQKLGNIRLHFGDAMQLIDWLPPACLARIDLLYPDPWPKRRHWKRRFIQDATLKALARILRPGGELHFATDIADYAAWTLARVLRSPDFFWTAERADDWRRPWAEFGGTRYETKAKREGRAPAYFIFRRV